MKKAVCFYRSEVRKPSEKVVVLVGLRGSSSASKKK